MRLRNLKLYALRQINLLLLNFEQVFKSILLWYEVFFDIEQFDSIVKSLDKVSAVGSWNFLDRAYNINTDLKQLLI